MRDPQAFPPSASSSTSTVTPVSSSDRVLVVAKKSSSTTNNPLLYSFLSMSQSEKALGAPRKVVSRMCYLGGGYVETTTRYGKLWFCFAEGELEDIFGSEEPPPPPPPEEGGSPDVAALKKRKPTPAKRKRGRKKKAPSSVIPSFLIYDDEESGNDAAAASDVDEDSDDEYMSDGDDGPRLYWPPAAHTGGGAALSSGAFFSERSPQLAPVKRGRGRPPGSSSSLAKKSAAGDYLLLASGAPQSQSRVTTRGGGRPRLSLYHEDTSDNDNDAASERSDESCLSRDSMRAVEVFSSRGRVFRSRYPTLDDACKGLKVSKRVIVNALTQQAKMSANDEPVFLFEQGNHPLKELLVRWEPLDEERRGKIPSVAIVSNVMRKTPTTRGGPGSGRGGGGTSARKVCDNAGGGGEGGFDDEEDHDDYDDHDDDAEDDFRQTDWWYQQLDKRAESLKSSVLLGKRRKSQATSRLTQDNRGGGIAVTPGYYSRSSPYEDNNYACQVSETVWAAEQVVSFGSPPHRSSTPAPPPGRPRRQPPGSSFSSSSDHQQQARTSIFSPLDDIAKQRLGLCMVCQLEVASVLYQPCGCVKVCEKCERVKETGIMTRRSVSTEAFMHILPFGWCGFCLCNVGARYVAAVDGGDDGGHASAV